jgi:hypothetical protein
MNTAQSVSGKIGQTRDDKNPATVRLTVHVPLASQIERITAFFANQPWGEGESEYHPTDFSVPTPIVGLNGQAYAEWPHGWAYAKLESIGSDAASQYVIVEFSTWKHDNSRQAKLEVTYSQ